MYIPQLLQNMCGKQAEANLNAIQKMLAEMRCPFQADSKTCIVSLQQKDQPKFDDAVKKLMNEYMIEIE